MDARVSQERTEQPDNLGTGAKDAPFPVAVAVVAFIVTLGLYSFLNSPYFDVAAVTVRGNKAVAAEELQRLASVYPGDKLLQVDLRKLAERVANHPRVRHVQVDRRLPDTLLIVVQEHEPVAWVSVPEGAETDESSAETAAVFTGDADGDEAPRRAAVNEAGEEIPLVGDEGDRLPVVVPSRPDLLQVAVAAAADMPLPLRAMVESIDAADGGDGLFITARTRTGGVILFGDDDELPRKAAIAASLLETADYAVVDVRFPRSPAVRPR